MKILLNILLSFLCLINYLLCQDVNHNTKVRDFISNPFNLLINNNDDVSYKYFTNLKFPYEIIKSDTINNFNDSIDTLITKKYKGFLLEFYKIKNTNKILLSQIIIDSSSITLMYNICIGMNYKMIESKLGNPNQIDKNNGYLIYTYATDEDAVNYAAFIIKDEILRKIIIMYYVD